MKKPITVSKSVFLLFSITYLLFALNIWVTLAFPCHPFKLWVKIIGYTSVAVFFIQALVYGLIYLGYILRDREDRYRFRQ